jgi:predicted metal-dependent HD superfamily phosphohydrolase
MGPFKKFKKQLEQSVKPEKIKELEILWNNPKRFYHNISHLSQIISDIEKNIWFSELQVFEKNALLLAAFFHDAIYDPKKKDNEDQSIKFFKESNIIKDKEFVDIVVRLIETTKYRKRPINKLAKIFWDADNSGFYKGYNVLLKNEKLIRKEFSWVSPEKYKEGRIKFLRSNLGLFGSYVDNDINKLIKYVEKTYK